MNALDRTVNNCSSAKAATGGNPVIRTNKRGATLVVVLYLFIRTVGLEIGRKLRQQFVRRTEQLITVRRLRPPRAEIPSSAPSPKSLENVVFSRLFAFLFAPIFRWQTHHLKRGFL